MMSELQDCIAYLLIMEIIRSARVIIVAAGMEGALPSVVAGLSISSSDRHPYKYGIWNALQWICSTACNAK